jgi:hypothetical protein
LAFALASAGAYAQTAPGCPQKAADGGNNPSLTQKAADAGNNPTLPQKAAEGVGGAPCRG